MMEIKNVILQMFRNQEHYQYQTEFNGLITRFTPGFLNVVTAYSNYQPLYLEEGIAFKLIRKSAKTKSLVGLDTQRDEYCKGIAHTITAACLHISPEIREAGKRLKIVLDTFGNIAVLPYRSESATITRFVAELRGTHGADSTAVGLDEWINALDDRNTAFMNLTDERYSEEETKTVLRMKEVRVKIDAAYTDIVKRINALALVDTVDNYSEFIAALNLRIDSYNNMLAQRKGRNAGEEGEGPKK